MVNTYDQLFYCGAETWGFQAKKDRKGLSICSSLPIAAGHPLSSPSQREVTTSEEKFLHIVKKWKFCFELPKLPGTYLGGLRQYAGQIVHTSCHQNCIQFINKTLLLIKLTQ